MTENPFTQDNATSIIQRAKAILLEPNQEWPKIAARPETSADVFVKYAVPLALIGPLATFVGGQVFGYGVFGMSWKPTLIGGLTTAVISFVLGLVSLVVLTLIADFLAPKFDGTSNRNSAFRLVAYSLTASWVAGVFGLIPSLGFLALLGLYSLYLLYAGSGPMMAVPEPKRAGYVAVCVIAGIVLSLVVATLTASLGALVGVNPLSSASSREVSGSMNIPGLGSVDINKLEQAGERMEKLNTGEIKPIDSARLAALLPASLGALTRTANETTAMGGMGSNASATYEGAGSRIELKITDMAALGGLGGLASAFGVEHSEENAEGYEKIHKVDGQMVTEKWNNSGKNGSYGRFVGDRFMIEAEGNAASIDALKAAVDGIDQGALAGLGE